MTPVVQKERARSAEGGSASDEHWSMLVFESLSVGTMMVLVVMLAALMVVGVYVMLVWPLTFWDLSELGLENYGSWARTALWSVFAGGSLAGYWCVSGAAFRHKSSRKAQRAVAPGAKGTRG
jgi:hypothetical protein